MLKRARMCRFASLTADDHAFGKPLVAITNPIKRLLADAARPFWEAELKHFA